MPKHSDEAVIKTADDAILSKLYASSMGYFYDPFIRHFAHEASGLATATASIVSSLPVATREFSSEIPLRHNRLVRGENHDPLHQVHAPPCHATPLPKRRRGAGQPIIRRGTYARVCCVDRCISGFLYLPMDEKSSRLGRQVVVLGAGKDTSYLRYKTGALTSDLSGKHVADCTADPGTQGGEVRWYEVDFPSVVEDKQRIVKNVSDVRSIFHSDQLDRWGRRSLHYLIGHDLRSPMRSFFDTVERHHGFQRDAPTLFVLECVQMYLQEVTSRDVLRGMVEYCTNPVVALYDPILLNDQFGRVMESHLSRAGAIDMAENSAVRTRTLKDQVEKILECGFDLAIGCDMMDAYETVVTDEQRGSANRCEVLDEFEEWVLIMKHYCLVVGGKRNDKECAREGLTLAEKYCAVGTSSPVGFVESRCLIRKQ